MIISELITSAGSIESPTAVEPPSLLSAYSSDREANAKSAGHQSFGLDNQLRLTRPNQVHLPWPAQQHSQRLHKQQYVALAIPATGHLDIREPTSGHTNIISDLSLIRAGGGQTFLVSASMDGSIKFWK
ncbi:unnamed protein product [Protopolystoma xenopodis]|uniref:Uncharacterized protein n=1 Tax=Protopolystoma xenopodis TaxID=117903 RepID=A0A3S5C9E7_9PLAT|nr:unnamed protein product [Protopolystoma xenopodis]